MHSLCLIQEILLTSTPKKAKTGQSKKEIVQVSTHYLVVYVLYMYNATFSLQQRPGRWQGWNWGGFAEGDA